MGKWHGRRTIAYAESDRFEDWPIPHTIVAPDVHDGPDTDIYTNSYTPWPGAAGAHLMFPASYQRAFDVTEVHLMTSRDGQHWQRPLRGAIVPTGDMGTHWLGGVYAGCGLVAFRPDEWSLPIGPKWCTHNEGDFLEGRPATPPHRGYLCRAIWRPDGLLSVEAVTEGQFTTVPMVFTGDRLEINAWTRFAGEIRFELVEAFGDGSITAGAAIPGYAFDDCDPVTGDALQHVVSWRGQSDLSAWSGKPMRLRIWMRRARLHAIQFR